jgi:hypothetical protein
MKKCNCGHEGEDFRELKVIVVEEHDEYHNGIPAGKRTVQHYVIMNVCPQCGCAYIED